MLVSGSFRRERTKDCRGMAASTAHGIATGRTAPQAPLWERLKSLAKARVHSGYWWLHVLLRSEGWEIATREVPSTNQGRAFDPHSQTPSRACLSVSIGRHRCGGASDVKGEPSSAIGASSCPSKSLRFERPVATVRGPRAVCSISGRISKKSSSTFSAGKVERQRVHQSLQKPALRGVPQCVLVPVSGRRARPPRRTGGPTGTTTHPRRDSTAWPRPGSQTN